MKYIVSGDVALDIPLSGLPKRLVSRRLALPGETQMYKLLCTSLRLHATVKHTVQGRLRSV